MTEKEIAIIVDDVVKTYKLYGSISDRMKEALDPFRRRFSKDHHALKNIQLKIHKGESIGIIGNNGSGKSTLLKIITGVVSPSQGQIYVNGKISAILELASGFNQDLNGIDNIFLNASLNGLSREETKKKLGQIIDFAELGDFIYQPIKTYSSGMNARLAFSVAVCIDPDVFIVDEALSVGDAAFSRKCIARMEQIKKNNATILFVSHGISSIVSLCERVIWLDKGQVVLDGDPKLVTGLYLRNSGDASIDINKVREQYHEILGGQDPREREKKKSSSQAVLTEAYDINLKTKSIISYPENGAVLSNFGILNEHRDSVNILSSGKLYRYHYDVTFEKGLYKVQYSFLIKDKDGVNIAGGVLPSINEWFDFQDGRKHVEIAFKCDLNPGYYYFNAGVVALLDDKIDYAHRVLDAYMFRVEGGKNMGTGFLDLIDEYSVEAV
ncbi:ABC transporter ATP-binding protein [Desulfogranum japonicum]|uniref:ABC transporter ATP-binding protein n=1 Tax=Desulfogranum japonicum TaxID=231447 RepID=UPI00041017F1|nr:ABC transporter ATP-binding protein [Desulfogranum japonicum]